MSETYDQPAAPTASARGMVLIHPPSLALGLLVVGLILHLAGRPPGSSFPFHQLIGLLLVAVGTGLCLYAAAVFAARDTTKNPYGKPAAFVTIPPYTFTRNPMYVGITMVLAGCAIFFGSAVMVLAPVLFVVVIDRMVIPQEEQTMERIYGQQYRDYQGRVARWLKVPGFQG